MDLFKLVHLEPPFLQQGDPSFRFKAFLVIIIIIKAFICKLLVII